MKSRRQHRVDYRLGFRFTSAAEKETGSSTGCWTAATPAGDQQRHGEQDDAEYDRADELRIAGRGLKDDRLQQIRTGEHERQARGRPDADQPSHPAEDQTKHRDRPGANGDPDADLALTPRDRIGDDAMEPDCR